MRKWVLEPKVPGGVVGLPEGAFLDDEDALAGEDGEAGVVGREDHAVYPVLGAGLFGEDRRGPDLAGLDVHDITFKSSMPLKRGTTTVFPSRLKAAQKTAWSGMRHIIREPRRSHMLRPLSPRQENQPGVVGRHVYPPDSGRRLEKPARFPAIEYVDYSS